MSWRHFLCCGLISLALAGAGCSKKSGGAVSRDSGGSGSPGGDTGGAGGNPGQVDGRSAGEDHPPPSTGGQGGSGGAAGAGGTGAGGTGGGGAGGGGQGGQPPPATGLNVLSSHYNEARTGVNTSETILTTSNVKPATFGLKFSAPIAGKMYAQPLYVSQLMVGGAKHNVVFAATAHNTVHAFDADDGTQLWMKALEAPLAIGGGGINVSCQDMSAEVGITSTPVISLEDSRIYVVAKTSGKQMLHALNLTTGEDATPPAQVGDPGFPSNSHLNRPGLLLLGGVVYIAFGSHCDDGNYKGWIFGHDAKTLAYKSRFTTTPNGRQGAIWQSGAAPATDGTSIFVVVGNGTSSATDMGFNVVKLTPTATGLNVAAHFLDTAAGGDNDLAGGPMLYGDQVISGGKAGDILLSSASDITLKQRVAAGGEVHIMAVWNGSAGTMVYAWPRRSSLHAWQLSGNMMIDKGTNGLQMPNQFGGILTVSSNGTMPGTGVLWVVVPTGVAARAGGTPGTLFAFDATDVTKQPIWSSDMDPQDALGGNAKFSTPTVANGKVYVATFTGKLMVYGLK